MAHPTGDGFHAGLEGYGKADQRAVDLFVQLDALLALEGRQPVNGSPSALVIAERCAVRILCKHYGWRVTDPGTLRRVV